MTGPTRLAASLLLALVAGGIGRLTAPDPELQPEPAAVEHPGERAADWREAMAAARSTSDAGSLRAEAHEVLNTAEADLALADAVDLLGWTGADTDVPWLESLARSGDPVLEEPAIRALGRLGTPSAVGVLLALEGRRDLRHQVLDALGRTRDPRALDRLRLLVGDDSDGASAALALARTGDVEGRQQVELALSRATVRTAPGLALALARFPGTEAREALYTQLRGGSRIQRDAALTALAQVRDPVVLDLLLDDLDRGTAQQKLTAARMLGALGDPRALNPLRNAALRGSQQLQGTAVGAIAALDTRASRDTLLDLVDTGPANVATQAVWSLPEVEEDEVVAVLAGCWRRRSWDVRQAIGSRLFHADWRLDQVPPEVLQIARRELAEPPPNGASDAPAFLLQYGDEVDIDAVEALLLDGPTMTRVRIVQALAEWPGASADRLLFARVEDADPSVREAAVRALLRRGIEGERLEAPLLAQLEASSTVNSRIEQLLVELGTPGALAAVQARITEGTTREQYAAVQALAWQGDADTTEALLAAAEEAEDPSRRRQIYQSMMWSSAGSDPELADRLLDDEDPSIRGIGIQLLGRQGPEARDQLLELASSDDLEVRGQALSHLGSLAGPEVEAVLLDALEDPLHGSSALSALSNRGTSTAREAVLTAATDHPESSVRVQALHQLSWQPTEGAQAVLRDALEDEDQRVRGAALTALESAGTSAAAREIAAMLDHEDDQLAVQAAGALERLGGPLAAENADRIDAVQEAAWGNPGELADAEPYLLVDEW